VRVDGQEPDMRRERRTSGRLAAKSIFIKDAKRRFGTCARKATELTPGDLLRVPISELRASQGVLTADAEVSRGAYRPSSASTLFRDSLGSHTSSSVRSNQGGPGVDGMTIEAAKDHLRQHWPNIRAQLLEGPISRSRSNGSKSPSRAAGCSACLASNGAAAKSRS
jgi:hypothetical protein